MSCNQIGVMEMGNSSMAFSENHLLQRDSSNSAESNKSPRVLIVDDQPYNIQALEIIMKTSFKLDTKSLVCKAFNGFQAIEEVKKSI